MHAPHDVAAPARALLSAAGDTSEAIPVRVAAPDVIAALSLADRLRHVRARAARGFDGDFHVTASAPGTRALELVLSGVHEWLRAYDIDSTTISVRSRSYVLRRPSLLWTDL